MRGRSSFLRVVVPATAALAIPFAVAASASCSGPHASPEATVLLAPSIVAPDDLLHEIATFKLVIYPGGTTDGSIQCEATGGVSGDILTTPIYTASNAQAGSSGLCGPGVARCFVAASLKQSTTPLVFAVTGYSDAAETKPIALGCATATLDQGDAQATYSLPITMVAIPAKEVCGNSVLEPPETCDPPTTDGECSSTCQTSEQLLSSGTGAAGSITETGAAGDKSSPSFVWPLGGDFSAFFTDTASGSPQISLRLLSDTLAPTNSSGSVAESESIYLPNSPDQFPPNPEAQNQKQPVGVSWGGDTYVVFADDTNNSGPNDDFGIRLRAIDSSLDALESNACDISDSTSGESGSLTSPAVALSGSGTSAILFIAWQDDSGNIYGRTYTPDSTGACGTLGTQELLSTGTSNSHVSVAGIIPALDAGSGPSGWVAVWQSGSDVVIRSIGPGGRPGASPTPLEVSGHTASSPTVASIPRGSGISIDNVGAFVVAWADQAPGASATTIFAERFTNTGTSRESSPVQISTSVNGGGELSPFAAASPAVGGSYAVTWVDQGTTSQVRARLLAGTAGSLANASGSSTGYLQNAVDGTTGEFQVSVAGTRTRVTPTVVAGGGTTGGQPYMAFGWADNSATGNFGIIARRFPLPTQ